MTSLPWKEIVLFAGAFVAGAAASIAIIAIVLARLPASYFRARPVVPDGSRTRRIAVVVLENLLGYAVIAIGMALSIPGVPGQGVLTMLVGLMLISFPGKRRLERFMIRRQNVARAANWIRRQAGKAPFEPP
ncbi:MAG: hypothetical protein HY903_21505 [Deltaproteobacteria bacterium]|nr:hypothetical protein [Deltaproteobacteria bacterium]